MSQKKLENYGLYQTLSSKIPNGSLSDQDKDEMSEKIENLSYDQREAFFMLICEHARLKDGFQYDTHKIPLPYSIKQEENDVLVDFSILPDELQWIIWKFFNVIQVPEKHNNCP